MDDIPPEVRGGIVTDPNEQWCKDHLEDLAEWDIPTLNAVLTSIQTILETDRFYRIAYEKKNGYGMPDDVDTGDIPEGEQPGTEHINQALEEISPVCCFITDNVENRWEDQDIPPIVGILAAKAAEED